ncbi:Z1 domain-containing protein [Motilibacter peucedani]|nr:Z1 domain-containing protein [Motilibacter peucedani]
MEQAFASRGLSLQTRAALWASADDILSHGPLACGDAGSSTGLALGYVQSGKTTAITALIAAAADDGYRVIVALMGSTNLLLQQNQERLLDALGVGEREDYRWVHLSNPAGAAKAKEIRGWLDRGRVVLVPVLKHAGRIDALAKVLSTACGKEVPVLVVDDEADQASLNTEAGSGAESRTYAAIAGLRSAVPKFLYVQFTATPYAPLLLEPDDQLRPSFVHMLRPGHGYTGGREFFVDHADIVVRAIPTLDEQRPRTLPTVLSKSLVQAVGSFIAGTALLLAVEAAAPPVSMLVHSTQRNDVQARYHFLINRLLQRWTEQAKAAATAAELPSEILDERRRITTLGGREADDFEFLTRVRYVLSEATLWLVNSASDVNKVDWKVAPVHLLVGGNKLDRGFTVEGLTVTYMNRPASDQLDTLEQRARAFGYRGDLLPYCQFFATPRTLAVLRGIVDTEYDLRARLRDWLDEGKPVGDWARSVGLLLPPGTRPTRQSVIAALSTFNAGGGWHQLRRPSLAPLDREANALAVEELGLLTAPSLDYGRLHHPTLHAPLRAVAALVREWRGAGPGSSPGWRQAELADLLERQPDQSQQTPVVLMQHPDGGPRTREWDVELGFVNLMQGADTRRRPDVPFYEGDRAVGGVREDPSRVVIQVHRVISSRSGEVPELYTLVVHAGEKTIVRRVSDG